MKNLTNKVSEYKYQLNVKTKKNNKVTIDKTSKCHLITNLNYNEYDDEKVKNI